MKKFISLMLVTLMMVTMMPQVLAAGATDGLTGTNMLGIGYTYAANTYDADTTTSSSDFTEMPAITAVGEGVESGDKLFGNNEDKVTYTEGDNIAEKLSDGYYFTYGEKAWSESKGVMIDGTATQITTNAPADSTANMVKFTKENSGIDFTWTTAQTVARLNLWAWPADAIDGYEIQYQIKTGGPWFTAKTGSLDYGVSTEKSATNSTFYQIILDETVTAVALRFLITSFAEEYKDEGVYITEAVPRSTNEINLVSYNPQAGADIPLATNKTASSYSIYVDRATYAYTNATTQAGRKIVSNYGEEQHRLHGWVASADIPNLGSFDITGPSFWRGKSTDSVYAYPYYAVDFGEAKHRINHITFRTHTAITGLVGIQLWCTDDEKLFLASSASGDNTDWTKVADFEETYGTQKTYSYDIADAPEARFWKVAIKGNGTSDAMLQYGLGMYSLSDLEVSGMYKGDSYKLNDDVRLTYKEWRTYAEDYDYGYAGGGAAALKNGYFLKFSEADTGIEWNFSEAKQVKAVDLWTWPAYAINNYELWYDDNGEWKKAKEDTFNPDSESRGGISAATGSEAYTITYWNSIVLDEEIETEKLKFVIKDLNDDEYGAYIAEADVRSTNNINLIATDSASNDGRSFSIYPSHFKASNTNVAAGNPWRGWPNGTVNENNGNLYHAVRFFETRHAINRVTLNISTGKVNEFEVYYANSDDAWSAPTDDSLWTKAATVSGSFTDSVTAEIADAPKAEYWKIKVTDFESGTSLSVAGLYELAEGELSEAAVSGTVSGGKVTVSLDKLNTFYEGKKAGEAKVYFALYSGNALQDVKVIGVNLDDTADADLDGTADKAVYAVYTVPTGVSGTLKLKAFIWNGDGSLQPLTTTPVIIQ